ncbi:MAG TPA: hypothetical protein PLO89_09015 [Spirochaetota bacterium]|nr:hypothetical protein [Spirochaetota bacterium]
MKKNCVSIFIIALGINAFSCTIFSYVSEDGIFIGNNEDYYYSAKPKIWIKPLKNKKYGRICFGFYINIIFPITQGGIGEKEYDVRFCVSKMDCK